jgi:hypothetical protein
MDIKDAIALPGARLQILIQEDTPMGQFNDALYFVPSEMAALTEADILAAKKARSDNWQAFVLEQSSKPPVKPTKEELEARKVELVAEVARVDAQLAEAVAIGDAEPIEEEAIIP